LMRIDRAAGSTSGKDALPDQPNAARQTHPLGAVRGVGAIPSGPTMASRPLVLTFAFAACFAAGCSTHPIADTCDYFKPGHLYPTKVGPYGGVCIPQGATFQGTSPSAPFGPSVAPSVLPPVPPPVPLPPSGPSVSVPTFPTAPPGSVVPVPPANQPPTTLPPPNFPR
jgi:hypothetical protein